MPQTVKQAMSYCQAAWARADLPYCENVHQAPASSLLPKVPSLFIASSTAQTMKRFLLLLLLLSGSLHAQADSAADKKSEVDSLLPSQKEFLNLPEKQRKDFAKNFGEASRYYQQKRIFEALDSLDKAEKIFPNSPELFNIRGACYTEMRSFDKATVAFDRALELNPENTTIKFNVAEVLFVTKKWQKAHDLFLEILDTIPERDMALARIVEFKLLLCKKKLGMDDEVVMLAEKYDYQDDSPYYYYAKAALAYEDNDLLKAEEWLARANRIFRNEAIIGPWQDSLVEFGYIKSFYGEDSPAEE